MKEKKMISDSKLEHLLLCKNCDVEYRKQPGFDDVDLIHKALPEVNMGDINISTYLFPASIHENGMCTLSCWQICPGLFRMFIRWTSNDAPKSLS